MTTVMKPSRITRRVAVAAALLGLSLPLVTTAQDAPDDAREKRRAARAAIAEELRAWGTENVLPTLLDWKERLDQGISADDLATLDRLREEVREVRTTIRTERRAIRQAWRAEDADALAAHRTALADALARRQEIIGATEQLALTYHDLLKEIAADAKPIVTEWRSEAKRIVTEWIAAHLDADDARKATAHLGRLRGLLPLLNASGHGRAVRFMLWDGEIPKGGAEQESADEATIE